MGSPSKGQCKAFDISAQKASAKMSSLISPAKGPSKPLDFSPQKLAALNSRYVSVSLKAADLDRVLDEKKMERDWLDEKIKGMEAARYTLENDKKRILLQIKNVRSQPSPSSSPSKITYSLQRSQDIRSFAFPSHENGATSSTSTISVGFGGQNIQKEKDFENKEPAEGFGDNDDDDELENEMLKIDTEQEPAQKKPKFGNGKDGKGM